MASRKQNESEKQSGLGEAPQATFEGAPLSGSIADWADEIAQEAKLKPAPSKTKPKTDAKTDTKKPAPKRGKKAAAGTVSAREKAAGGLNPIAA